MKARRLADEIDAMVDTYKAIVYQTAPPLDTDEDDILNVLENIKSFLSLQEVDILRACAPHANKIAVENYQPVSNEGRRYIEAFHLAIKKRDEEFAKTIKAL